ncbi:hypothetical protein ACWEHA_35545 [Amycolatopsis nivea]
MTSHAGPNATGGERVLGERPGERDRRRVHPDERVLGEFSWASASGRERLGERGWASAAGRARLGERGRRSAHAAGNGRRAVPLLADPRRSPASAVS